MSHRGTRTRMHAAGSVGNYTIENYVPRNNPNENLRGLNFGERRALERRALHIKQARARGVHFSSFPWFVRATNLKTNTVGYGRDAHEALEALRAGEYAVKVWDHYTIRMQRAEIIRQFVDKQR